MPQGGSDQAGASKSPSVAASVSVSREASVGAGGSSRACVDGARSSSSSNGGIMRDDATRKNADGAPGAQARGAGTASDGEAAGPAKPRRERPDEGEIEDGEIQPPSKRAKDEGTGP